MYLNAWKKIITAHLFADKYLGLLSEVKKIFACFSSHFVPATCALQAITYIYCHI